ncbi:MAG TPA: CRTAC1 family protein [Acidobacteriota bacterium]|nr:CRTAC1 family protein [Acidobacteriota bacterium]
MFNRRRAILLALVILLGAGFIVVRLIDQRYRDFFRTGQTLARTLQPMAQALRQGDMARLESSFAADFQGRPLGLLEMPLESEKDGISLYRFQPQDGLLDRNEALSRWKRYRQQFESVEHVEMHVHRLERWGSTRRWTASVRFELIGTLRDRPGKAVDRAYLRFAFQPPEDSGGLPRLVESGLLEGLRTHGTGDQFSNVASQAGIDFENQFYPGFLDRPLKFAMLRHGPAGISAADYDNDGFYDLFIPDGVRSRLFRNRGDGTFEDVTRVGGLGGLDGVSVGLFADFDNDGHKDFFVSRTFSPNQLFMNNGDGTFSDETSKSGLAEDCCTTVASAADYDNDGDLDLYVGRYLDPRQQSPSTLYTRNGEPNQLYRNRGDGTFENVTAQAGVGERGLCLGTVFGDYDDDGDADLYVANDFGRNTLYRNEGDGTFSDVTVESNTLAYGAGMNASMGDYDNDGDLDIYVTNIRSEIAWLAAGPTVHAYMLNNFTSGMWLSDMPLFWEIYRQSGFNFIDVFQQMAMGNNLLRNRGDGTFEDVTWQAHANPPGWFWGASLADFDNDGWQDIYAANGWVYDEPGTDLELDFFGNVISNQDQFKQGDFFNADYFAGRSWHGYERNRMLRADGRGGFLEVATPAGTGLLLNSRGVAVADFWNRGVLDIAVAASRGRHALLRNQVGERRNWLAVELTGTRSNRDAVGARVRIEAGGQEQMREVALGDGYGSQNSLRLYFGLAQAETVDRLTVTWPASGQVQQFENLAAGQIIRITEDLPTLARRAVRPAVDGEDRPQ